MSGSCLLWKTFFNKQYVVLVTVSPLLSCIVLYNTLEVTRKFLNNKGIIKDNFVLKCRDINQLVQL